jgi:hypothetical protein
MFKKGASTAYCTDVKYCYNHPLNYSSKGFDFDTQKEINNSILI